MAYLLLADRLIVHPVSIWQSRLARRLLHMGRLDAKGDPPTQLLMSRNQTVKTYLAERIPQLERLRSSQPEAGTELEYYTQHEETLLDDCELLDDHFSKRAASFVASWNKPLKHRNLIAQDASNIHERGPHLAWRIISSRPSVVSLHDAEQCCLRIKEIARDESVFFSTDVVLAELARRNWPISSVEGVRHRLAELLVEANVGDGIRSPLLSTIGKATLDPFDAEAFWGSMEVLLGRRLVRAIFCENDPITTCLHLRRSHEWGTFVPVYRSIVWEVSDQLRGLDEESLESHLRERFPGLFQLFWRRTGKMSLVALLCTFCSLRSGGPFAVNIGTIGAGLSIIPVLYSSLAVASDYLRSDRLILRQRIREILSPRNPYWRVSKWFE